MGRAVVLVCLSLAACGGQATESAAPQATSGGECAARVELAAGENALGACRASHAADAGWPARGQYDTILAHLSSHLASLNPPRVLTSEEVQPLAEGIWELLDQVDFPDGTDAARGRAEEAAERLLRDRGFRAAPGAAIEALDSVAQVAAVADPSGADPCAGEELRVGQARLAETECE